MNARGVELVRRATIERGERKERGEESSSSKQEQENNKELRPQTHTHTHAHTSSVEIVALGLETAQVLLFVVQHNLYTKSTQRTNER